jgi:hypothetical protein
VNFGAGTEWQMDDLGELWCRLMHDSPRWPIHGEYECGTCFRHYPVPWANGARELSHFTPPPFTQTLASARR